MQLGQAAGRRAKRKKRTSGDLARGYISSLNAKPPGVCISSSLPDRYLEIIYGVKKVNGAKETSFCKVKKSFFSFAPASGEKTARASTHLDFSL